MDWSEFQPGSPLHQVCLLVSLVLSILAGLAGWQLRPKLGIQRWVRWALAMTCLVTWSASALYPILTSQFDWSESLPLHYCNWANLIAAAALWKRDRLSQSLLYFWAFGLCLCAFFTPVLNTGPATAWFWIFWLYHLVILITVVWVLVVDQFRPTFRDLCRAIGVSLGYMTLMALLNRATGWNYAFVGESTTIHPTPLDWFGPYPIRLVWIAVAGSLIFLLLWLPWPASKKTNPTY